MLAQGAKIPIGLIPYNYSVSDLNIFNKKLFLFCYICFDNFSVVNKRVVSRGTKAHWVYSLIVFFQFNNIGDIFMCFVLTGIWTEQYDQIMRGWSSKPHSGISQVLESAAYWCVILPRRSCYYSPCRNYHTSSSAYLGVPGLSPGIYAYHTRSFAHLCVSCLCTIIPTSYPATPPPSGSCFMTLSSNRLLLLSSRDIPSRVS